MEPLRPSDAINASDQTSPTEPVLGVRGWGRFIWRQLTSMKTALFLLLLLALAAIPGSLVPQRSADPNGVLRYRDEDPELYELLDSLQLFDTYTSVWFSAIYILLFISLVGCILPRTSHHLKALRQPPPRTPKNLDRLEAHRLVALPSTVSEQEFLAAARATLGQHGYRTADYGSSVAGEKGYLRETANLVFHFALVGILLSLALGTGFKYSGQRVLVEGQSFTNDLASYDSFTSGAFVDESSLNPYGLRLEQFEADYEFNVSSGVAQPLDFRATMAVVTPESSEQRLLRVNEPLSVEDTTVYLLGNGYAPWITVRDGNGEVAFSQPVVFLPQDGNLTSVGVVKVPDGLDRQVGMMGFFYPSAVVLDSGALSSVYPEPDQPIVTLNVFTGDLGLDEGIPRNVYSLDTESLTLEAGRDGPEPALVIGLGQTVDLPDGLGTVTFESLPRFVSVDIHRDPTQLPVAVCALLIFGGLVSSLFVVRRRVWLKLVRDESGQLMLEAAALARNEDPGQDHALDDLVQSFSQNLPVRVGA